MLMAVPPTNFQLHNSLFPDRHFHNVIIGGVLFGAMAGYNYWRCSCENLSPWRNWQ
jgi:cytochrome o ubiquinol oxidase subunit 1